MDNETKYINVSDVTKIYGIKRGLVYQWAAEKKIPVLKVGKKILIPVKEFEAFLETNTIKAEA